MTNKLLTFKTFEIIEYYYKNGSIRKTASEFGIHYNTLYKWLKKYKKGEEIKSYKRPWNRLSKDIEEKICLLKEKNPHITLKKTKEILHEQGIKVSLKGIWNVWKRYGYGGFRKENMTNDFTEYCDWTPEAKKKYETAEYYYKKGDIKKCAMILNSIPLLPKNGLIKNIPDRFLNLNRKIEKYHILFGEMPIKYYLNRVENLYRICKDKNLNYSSLRIGSRLLIALEWEGKPYKLKKVIGDLKNIMGKRHSPLLFEPRFTLLISESLMNILFFNKEKAREILRRAIRLLKNKKFISPYFLIDIGVVYFRMEDYKKAKFYFLKSLPYLDELTKGLVLNYLSKINIFSGNLKVASKLLKNSKFYKFFSLSEKYLFLSYIYLLKGKPLQSISFFKKGISILKKREIADSLFNFYLCGAAAFISLSEKNKGMKILKDALRYMNYYKKEKEKKILEILTYEKEEIEKDITPSLRLLKMLKQKNLKECYYYSLKKDIRLYYYLYNLLNPKKAILTLKRGEKTYLPKSLLNLPLFTREFPMYNIKFLKNFIIYKNQNYLKVKLTPKEKSFLIHFALRAGEKGREIPLYDIFENYFKNSKKPMRSFLTFLYRLKRKIKLPPHLIQINKKSSTLKNNGVYLVTDYNDYEISLAKANAFLNAGKWKFAKREFIKALSIFKTKPFEKIYDTWSEDLRTKILTKHYNEFEKFKKELLIRKDYKTLKKLLSILKRLK